MSTYKEQLDIAKAAYTESPSNAAAKKLITLEKIVKLEEKAAEQPDLAADIQRIIDARKTDLVDL